MCRLQKKITRPKQGPSIKFYTTGQESGKTLVDYIDAEPKLTVNTSTKQ